MTVERLRFTKLQGADVVCFYCEKKICVGDEYVMRQIAGGRIAMMHPECSEKADADTQPGR